MSTRASVIPGFGWQMPVLLALLLLVLIGCVAGFFASSLLHEGEVQERTRRLSAVDDQERLALTLSRHAPRAMSGIESSFAAVRHARANAELMLASLRELFAGDERVVIAPLEKEWASVNNALDLVLAAEEPILGLRESLETLRIFADQLELHSTALVEGADQWEFEPGQVYAARNLQLMTTRLVENFRRTADTSGSLLESKQYRLDAKLLASMGDAITGLTLGDLSLGITRVTTPQARVVLEPLGELYRESSDTLKGIVSNTLVVVHVRETSETLAASAERIPAISAELRQRAAMPSEASPWARGIVRTGFAVAAMATLVVVAITILFGARSRVAAEKQRAEEARSRQEESSEINRRNQDAILTLLDEISALADGDLTMQATVTEDITGAIADAVNYAIEALREIVANINDTSAEVRSAALKTQNRAAQLSEASALQVGRIAEAGDALGLMSNSVERIALEANESSHVAVQSVEIAKRGAGVVRDTIGGMNAIRQTMQDTSKRLKRLGESSQEIGDIVSLIDDIADQTNMLALNAAIQASMAGEAGRGFAVVADEVQRLAERAGQATKQIETLVKAIQTDTHEAVASMEQNTAGVVSGARVAAGAGKALAEIESVSTRLADRIEGITLLARSHTEQAGEILLAMESIREITTQTQSGTDETARSIGTLAEVADALRGSVEGFTLPERDYSSTVTLRQQLAARRAAALAQAPTPAQDRSRDDNFDASTHTDFRPDDPPSDRDEGRRDTSGSKGVLPGADHVTEQSIEINAHDGSPDQAVHSDQATHSPGEARS
jgi:twitching motility protein PilJ